MPAQTGRATLGLTATARTGRLPYVVGAVKIAYEDRDIAHAVISVDDDREYFNIIGADDDEGSDSKLPIGENVTYRVELTEAEADLFASASNCRYVELDTVATIDADMSMPAASSMRFMRADFARIGEFHGRDVLVAVIDGGTTAAVRSFLGATMVARKVFGPDDPGAREYTSDHGSKVAACLIPFGGKFVDAVTVSNAGVNNGSDAAAAFRWATDNGAKIVNYSASGTDPNPAYVDAIEYMQARGAQLFATAGNLNQNTIRWPAGYSTTYSNVFSTISFDENTGARSTFSNYDNTATGCAPGTKVLGLSPTGTPLLWDGTSASSPYAAQLCARGATGGRFTPAQVGAALKVNTRDTGQPDEEQGGGAYDLEAALTALGALSSLPAPTFRRNLCTNPSLETNATGYALGPLRDGITAASFGRASTIPAQPGTFYGTVNITGSGVISPDEPDVEISLPSCAVVGGQAYTFSVHSRHVSPVNPSVVLSVSWENASGTTLGRARSALLPMFNSVWVRYHLTATAPPGATKAVLSLLGASFTDTTARSWRWDGVHYEQTATLKPYFDGATAGAAWTGVAHNSTSTIGVDLGSGGSVGSPPTQALGVGGIATPAGAILTTTDSTSALTITTGGTASNQRVYDGQGHTVGRITVQADYVTVQNFNIRSGNRYGAVIDANNVIFQNNDIKNVQSSNGTEDLNAITAWGDSIKIRYNTAINFVTGSPGTSHTDFIQTWVETSHPIASANWEVVGNKAIGPANPSRLASIASIHQCIMAEGLNANGNSGGNGNPHNWLIADNEFGDSGSQSIMLDGVDNVDITRNKFVGSSDKVLDAGDTIVSTNVKYYSDNTVLGSYGSVGYPITSGPGPGAIVIGGGTGTPGNDADAVLIIKAPTGTNTITGNRVFTTTSAAGLTLSGGAWRKTGFGPQLVLLERANVGIAGDPTETDGTGLSITGVAGDPGTGGGGTPTPGGGTGGGGGTGSADNPGDLLKVGLDQGFSKFNIGIGFLKGDPLDRDGDGHVDFTLAEIGNGLVVPGHFQMTSDNTAARLTVPASAGTTSSSTANPRTEFRELKQSGDGSASHPKAAWTPTSNDHKCFVRGGVIHAPSQKPQIVMVQTHDASDDTSMLRYHGGKLQCRIGDTVLSIGDINWNLNTFYDYGIQVTAGQVKFWFGPVGAPAVVYSGSFGWSTAQYFKTGCYLQANETNVDPDEYGSIDMSAVMCWHTGDPEPAVHLG